MKNSLKQNILWISLAIWLSTIWNIKDSIAWEVKYILDSEAFISLKSQNNEILQKNLWSNRIFVHINNTRIWEYRWDNEKNTYIAYRQSNWNLPLELKKWNIYDIVLIDKVSNLNFDLSDLENWFSLEDLKNIMISNYYDEDIENLIPKVTSHLNNILKSSNIKLQESQYITFIEKSTQTMFVFYYQKEIKLLRIVWYDRVSTWNSNRWIKNIETPSMIIDRSVFSKWDWKAWGTDWQWYGEKWSRIRFLWKYYISKDWKQVSDKHLHNHREIHLAIHTTTPWWLTKLWNKMSEWCIRISRFSLELLKNTWIVDNINGRYLIIWDIKEDQKIYLSKWNTLTSYEIKDFQEIQTAENKYLELF